MPHPSGEPRPPLPANVKILGWTSFLNDVASEIIYPLLPRFVLGELGANKTVLGIIDGVAESTASLLKLAVGHWSDRIGQRKPFIVVGYVLAAVARSLTALVHSPWSLFCTRTGDRIGKGLRTAPRDAILADSTPPDQRGWAFGFHRGMDHAGAAVGPLLATVYLAWRPSDLRTLFALTIIPGLLVLVMVVVGLREPPLVPRSQREPTKRGPLSPAMRHYLFALLLFTLGNSSDLFLLARAEELGVPTTWIPTLWLVFHAVKSVGAMRLGRAVDTWGAKRAILGGWLVYSLVYLGFGLANQAWQSWALFLCYALFYALTEPAERKLVADLAQHDQQGSAFGWFHFTLGIGMLPASAIFGWWYDTIGPLAAFGWSATLALLATVLLSTLSTNSQLNVATRQE